jgi:hypothetical protein
VLRGENDLLAPDLYYRLILVDEADRPVARADAGLSCAADKVVEKTATTGVVGEIAYSDDFCSFDNNWPLIVGEGFDLGYHPPCFYHVESSRQHAEVLVMSGSDAISPAAIETDVLIRSTADSAGNFRYGFVVGSADSEYLTLTIQPAREGDSSFVLWCVQPPSETLVANLAGSGELYASHAPPLGSPDGHRGEAGCPDGLGSGRVEVESFENTLSLTAGTDSVTVAIDGENVGDVAVSMPTGDVGFFVQTYHMPLAHLHFDRLTVTSS